MNRIICVLVSLLYLSTAYSQSLDFIQPLVDKPTETIRSLGKFGDYNYSLSKGQVNIDIPIYDIITHNGYTNKLSLFYDHSGIQVEDKGGVAGINWSIMGLGYISRIVQGKLDDETTFGYNYNYDKITSHPSLYTPTGINDPIFRAAKGDFDLEPDYFVFSINGINGRFFYDPRDGKYYSMPHGTMKIESLPNLAAFRLTDEKGYVYEFEESSTSQISMDMSSGYGTSTGSYRKQWYVTRVTDPRGLVILEYEYISNSINTISKELATAVYHLYHSGSCFSDNFLTHKQTTNTFISQTAQERLVSKIKFNTSELLFFYSSQQNNMLKTDSIVLYKTANELPANKWTFSYSYYPNTTKLRLDSLCEGISDIKKYAFYYDNQNIPRITSKSQDYWGFYNGESNSTLIPRFVYNDYGYVGTAKREPVYEKTRAGILTEVVYPTKGRTAFEYELNDFGYLDNLQPAEIAVDGPPKNHFVSRKYATDGYGESTKSFDLSEPTTINYTSYRDNCNNREPLCSHDPCTTVISITGNGQTYSLNGLNKQSHSGTLHLAPGTYTIRVQTSAFYDYGQVSINFKEKILLKTGSSGGLRIRGIKNYDAEGILANYKFFEYLDNNDPDRSSGVRSNEPVLTYRAKTRGSCGELTLPNCLSWSDDLYVTSYSNADMFFFDGGTTSYRRVVEYYGDKNNNTGYIEHKFSYAQDLTVKVYPFSGVSSKFWRRGLPLETNYFDSTGKKMKTYKNEYVFDETNNKRTLSGLKLGFLESCPHQINMNKIVFGNYTFLSEWMYRTKSQETLYQYDDHVLVDSIHQVTHYFYDEPSHLQLTREKRQSSNGEESNMYISYAGDHIDSLHQQMQSNNLKAYPVEIVKGIKKGSNTYLVSGQLIQYSPQKLGLPIEVYKTELNSRKNLSSFKFSNRLTGNIPPSGIKTTFAPDSTYELSLGVLSHDIYGNPLEVKERQYTNTVYLWGYGGQYPVAKIENATYQEVSDILGISVINALYSPAVTDTIINSMDSTLRSHTGMAKARITIYTYQPLEGITSVRGPAGITEYYRYDSMQRLRDVLDTEEQTLKSYRYHYTP